MSIQYRTATKCPVHLHVRDECLNRLTTDGVFHKASVLEKTGFTGVAEAIRWDYIVRMIEEENGKRSLFPLAQRYFNERRKTEDHVRNPQRYIATGHGKKTAGYGLVCQENGHFVVKVLEYRKSMAKGTVKAFDESTSLAEERVPEIAEEAKLKLIAR